MNDILQSFVAGTARRDALKQQQVQNDLAQQQHDDLKNYHEGLLDEAFGKMDETARQNDVNNKIAIQLHDSQMQKAKNDLATAVQTGQPVVGSTLLGESVDPVTGYRKQRIQMPDWMHKPDGSPTIIEQLHPEDWAKSQANIERITNAPKTEQKITEQDALQKAETDKLTTVEDVRAAHTKTLEQMKLDAQKSAAELLRASQERIGAGHDKATVAGHQISASATMEAARIRTGAELAQSLTTAGPDGSTPADSINAGISSGKYTLEDLKKMFPGSPAVVQMFALNSAKNGVGFITPKQQIALPAWQQLGNAIPKMQKLIAQQSQSSNGLEAAGKGVIDKMFNSEYKNLVGELEAVISTIATTIGGEQGQKLSGIKIEKAKGWAPDPSLPPQENQKRLQDYINEVNSMFNSSMRNLSAAQRLHIQDELGISKFLLPQKKGSSNPDAMKKFMDSLPKE